MAQPRNIMKSLRVKDYIEASKYKNLIMNSTMNLPGTFAEFNFPFIVETATEQAAGYAKVYDASAAAYLPLSTSSSGAGYTNDYQIFPDTEVAGDYAIFGASSPFGVLRFDMSATPATYSGDAITWQYWNGSAWTTLTVIWDDTNTTPAAGGKRPFMQDGNIVFSAPSDWAAVEIDDQTAYWVRAYVATAAITQIPLTNSKEHQIITCTTGYEAPIKGNVGRGRVSFITASASNADSKFILTNLTTGACSAIKTLTKAVASGQEIADFDVDVNAGDVLAVYGTQEDGTTEFANGRIELTITGSN